MTRLITRLLAVTTAAAALLFASAAHAQYAADDTPTATPEATPNATPTEIAPPTSPTPTPQPPAAATITLGGATKLKLSGVLYAAYAYDMSQGPGGKYLGNRNGFDVTRAYLNAEPNWGDDYFGRVTLDVVRATTTSAGNASVNTTGSLVERLKYANFGMNVVPGQVVVRVGLQQTPWIDFEEGVWGYRVLNNTMAETWYGISSSDFGLEAYGKVANGLVEYQAGVFNGEGYTKPESNKFKEVSGRVTANLLPAGKDPGLRLSVYYGYALKGPAADTDKTRAIAMVSYQHAIGTVAAQYVYAQDGTGTSHVKGGGESVFGFVNLPFALPKTIGTRLVARVDMIDPNTDRSKDGLTRLIGGIAFRTTKDTQMVLDYQQLSPEDSAVKPTQTLFAHWQANF